MFLGMQDFYFA